MGEPITLEVLIRRNADEAARVYRYDVTPDNLPYQASWWRDGNGACDCNRHLFFERSIDPNYDDEDLNDGDGFGCGHGAYYIVSVANLATGETVYQDDA